MVWAYFSVVEYYDEIGAGWRSEIASPDGEYFNVYDGFTELVSNSCLWFWNDYMFYWLIFSLYYLGRAGTYKPEADIYLLFNLGAVVTTTGLGPPSKSSS